MGYSRERSERHRRRDENAEDGYDRHRDRHRRRDLEDDDDREARRKSDRERDRRRYNDEEDDHKYRDRRQRKKDEDSDTKYRRDKEKDRRQEESRKEDVKPVEDPKDKNERQQGNVNDNALSLGRSGGVYIPPFKLARMMKEVDDKSSVEYQRLTWDALRKSINGLVNKVNATNIKNIIPELFAENLIRGRGLFCRSCMKSQMASPGFTDVFAALVAVVNTKFPEVGELLLRRIVLQLKRAYKRNDKVSIRPLFVISL